MAKALEPLLEDLARGGAAAKRAVAQLRRSPPPGAAAALLSELTNSRIQLVSKEPTKQEPPKVREHVQAILESLWPHRDDPVVLGRVFEVYRGARDYPTFERAEQIVRDSKLPEAEEGILAALLGPRGSCQQTAVRRLRDIPVEKALGWLERMIEPARLKTEDGRFALREVMVSNPHDKDEDLVPLDRHPRYLDICAGLLGGPLHPAAVDALAYGRDRRAVEPLVERLSDFGEESQIAYRIYALQYLASIGDPAAISTIEQHLKHEGLHPEEARAAKKALAELRGGKEKPERKKRLPPLPKFEVSRAPAKDPAPARLQRGDGGHSLTFDAFDRAAAVFKAARRDGGGYGWAGVVDWLMRTYSPDTAEEVELDPEASLFVAVAEKRRPLLVVAALLQQALENPKLLREAIRRADPHLMD